MSGYINLAPASIAKERSKPLAVENGDFAPRLHIWIVRPAPAFRRYPLYVLGRVLDVASFAVDTILRVDDKAWICAGYLVRVNDFVYSSRTVKARRFSKPRKIITNRYVGIVQSKVNGLILFMICVGKIDGRWCVER